MTMLAGPDRPPRVLLVEDDPSTLRTVALYLRSAGYEVACRADGAGGLAAAEELAPDLVVLDLMLPGMDGREVCRRLRERGDVPVIMLTARTAEADRVEGLDLGADDYMPKPFSPRELVARVRAVLRRRPPDGAAGVLRRAGLTIDRDRHLVAVDGREVLLTPSEMTVLTTLASSPGRVFGRAQLAARLAAGGRTPLERTVDTHVLNLRKKIERDPGRPKLLETVVGVGYRFAEGGGPR
jgi:DNA-binding response OmpR family regulator